MQMQSGIRGCRVSAGDRDPPKTEEEEGGEDLRERAKGGHRHTPSYNQWSVPGTVRVSFCSILHSRRVGAFRGGVVDLIGIAMSSQQAAGVRRKQGRPRRY